MKNKKLSKQELQRILDKLPPTEYFWHGSPLKLAELKGSANKTTGADGFVFVTPKKAVARMMAPDSQRDIVDPIEKQLGKSHIPIFNIGYSGWGDPNDETEVVDIRVSTPEKFKPFKGKAKTYLHKIALKTIADRLYRWKYADPDTTNEFIVKGDIVPEDIVEVTVPYSVRKDPKGYIRPYPADRLRSLGLEHLLKDPAHAWRASTGLELIHREPDLKELKRIYRNWLKMSERAKRESDRKSLELFGKTNEDHYQELLSKYT